MESPSGTGISMHPSRDEALRASLATLPVGVFSLDTQGRCLLAEGGTFDSLGVDPATLPGRLLCDDARLPHWFCDTVEQALSTRRESRSDATVADKRVHLTVRPITDAEERVAWLVGSLHEFSSPAIHAAHEHLLLQERRARGIAEGAAKREAFLSEASRKLVSSVDWVTTIDTIARLAIPVFTDGCAVLIFDKGKLRQVTAVHRDPQIHQTFQELFARYPPDPGKPVGIGKIVATGESLFMRVVPDAFLRALARNAENLDLLRRLQMKSYAGVPLSAHGKVLGVLIFATKDRCFSESDLGLAEELGRRCAAAIENAQLFAEVRHAVKVREDFLAAASHELRTPLTPLNLVLSRLEQKLGKEHRDALPLVRSARRSVERLRGLVGDLLDVAQLEAGRLTLRDEEIAFGELVEQMVENDRALSTSHTLIMDRGPGSMAVRGDRPRLEHVVANLVGNAIKYSPAGGLIRVRLSQRRAEVLLSVSDPGIGIAPEQHQRIFTRFFRSEDTPVAKYGGLGLGLYLTKQIVERHGGRIWFQSEPGRGSTFFVALPLSR